MPYLRQEATVLVCILLGTTLGLAPPLFTKNLIDVALARHDMHLLWLDVGGMVSPR